MHSVRLSRRGLLRWERLRQFLVVLLTVFAVGAISDEHVYRMDNGEDFDFDDAVGQWVVIAYWAIWCGPCREEIQILNAIHQEREKHNVIVLGMNFDGVQGEQLEADKARFGAEFPDLIDDPRTRWDEPRATVIPRTLVIGKDGKLHAVIVGSTTRAAILRKISD